MFINLLYLEIVIIFIIDLSGFTQVMKRMVGRILHVKIVSMKPFDCSLCMTWWCGLVYLLIVGEFNLGGVALVATMSFLSEPIKNLMLYGSDLLTKAIQLMYKILKLW